MATSKKVIGVLPVFKGEWEVTEIYSYLNRVSLYNCEFQSKLKEDNVGNAPASYDEENNEITFINTDKWLVVSDNRNAFTVDKKVDTKIAEIEKEIDDIPVDTFVTNEELETKLEDYVETTDIEDFITETKLTSTLENYIDKITFDGCKNELNESFTNVNNKIGAIDSRIGTITIVKNSENDLVYDLKIEDKVVSSINIPKDQFLKSVDYNTETKNITFVFVTSEGEKTTNIDVSDLVDTYTAGDGLNLSDNQFSVKDNAISENKLDESVKNSIKNAYEVIEFEDPNLKTYLLDSNIGGTIIPNEITVYEAEHTTALPSFQSTSFSSLKELYYFRNVTNEPSFCYLGTREVTFYNNQLNFPYGARQSSFTKVTLVNVSSMGSMALRGCTALETVIVLGSFANMSSTVTYDNTNPTWYIQDDLYNSFITVNSNVAGEKKKLSEYYDKVQISEGTEDGTIHVSGERGLSKDVKVAGWDELKESLPVEEELLDGGNIREFLEKKDNSELVAGKKYKVLFYDMIMHENNPPTNDVEFDDAFYIITTALTNNSVDTRVTALPPQDEIEGKMPALYKKHLPEMEINISFFEQDWWLMNSVKMGMTTFTFNPFIMYEEFSPIMEVESSTSIGEFSNPFFSTEKDFAKHIIENWKDVVFEMYDVERAYPCVFALLSTQRYPNLHNFKYSESGGFLLAGDLIDYQISKSNGYSDIEEVKSFTVIHGMEGYGGFVRVTNSNIMRSYISNCSFLKFVNCNISTINLQTVKNATFVNYREVLGLQPINIIQEYYDKSFYSDQQGKVIGVAGDDDYKGYIELKSDLSDLTHIQSYWDGTNLKIV